jgi:hypothetical protein
MAKGICVLGKAASREAVLRIVDLWAARPASQTPDTKSDTPVLVPVDTMSISD